MEEAVEVLGQGRGAGVTSRAGPSAGTSGRSSPGRAAGPAAAARRDRLLVDATCVQRLEHRGRLERRPAGQQLVEDRPQAVDVGRRADLLRRPSACSGAM